MKEDKISGVSYGIVLLAVLAGMALGVMLMQNMGSLRHREATTLQSKVDETMRLIENEYVEIIDEDSIADVMLNAMLQTLDPHSRYLSVKEMTAEMEMLTGEFEGVGMTLRRIKDTTCVASVFEGGPAAHAGLRPGDRIVSVDTTNVCGPRLKADDVVKLIRGPHGTRVELGVMRPKVEGVRHYEMKRQRVTAPSTNYSCMLDGQVGYIRLSNFADGTYREFHTALKELKDEGMRRLILDLRDNGGGLMDAAVKIASDLLPKGDMIVYTQGAHSWRNSIKSPGGGIYTEGPLTVMINEGSASASEIVSGAIQDNDRGTIVGRRSFGKGLVQRSFNLADGSALMLTVSKYYTPSGRCIQRPYDKGAEEYYLSNLSRMIKESGEDSIEAALTDTTQYRTKKGRVVYGGGGIIPDKIIPMKRYDHIQYYNELVRKGVILDYAFGLMSQNYEQLMKSYPTLEQFDKGYVVSNAMVEQIAAAGEREGVAKDSKALQINSEMIKTLTKAYIAQSLYGERGYYQIILNMDDELKGVAKE